MPRSTTSTVTQYKPPVLIDLWFVVSSILVFWDSGFMLLRPRSFPGGNLFWAWSPYELYSKTDYVYGLKAYQMREGFGPAQSILNLVENACNMLYLYLNSRNDPTAVLVGFTGAVATFWKTTLYWLMDQQCGWCQTGHNPLRTWIILFAIPNGFWLVVPFIIIVVFGRQIARTLRESSKVKKA